MRISSSKPSCVPLAQRGRQGGASYFEFAIVAIIFAILTGVLLQKLNSYQQEAERLAVQQVVASLRAALASKAASLYLKGNEAEMMALLRRNPMELLEHAPQNYAGEFDSGAAGSVKEGQWYFDRSSATLSYLLNAHSIFGGDSAKHLNFKVKFAQIPSNITNIHEGPGPGGVTLEQIND